MHEGSCSLPEVQHSALSHLHQGVGGPLWKENHLIKPILLNSSTVYS